MDQEPIYQTAIGNDAPSVGAPKAGGDSIVQLPSTGRRGNAVKDVIFQYLQPAFIVAIIAFWGLSPKWLTGNPVTAIVASYSILIMVISLEFINERHAHWRLTKREFFEGLFYVLCNRYVLAAVGAFLIYHPLNQLKQYLGWNIHWSARMPFIAQVVFILFLHEFVQYWFHRMLHNNPVLWEVHVPHHYLTQMNTMNSAVGNWIEILFLGLSLVIFFDMPKTAIICAGSIGGVVASFSHSNIRFNPPRWYSFFFTTIESHSLHHSLNYDDTRCNYSNALIVIDRMFGTHREGEAVIVGQDNQRRLSIWEQSIWPFLPFIAKAKAGLAKSATAT